MPKAFTLNNIEKEYGDFKLGPLQLDLEHGRVMGFIGPNGAGKTTTMYIMSGHIVASAGQVIIDGQIIDHRQGNWKNQIGFVAEDNYFYENWPVNANLKAISKFFDGWDNEYMEKLVERLEMPLKKKVRELSKGNRTKLAIITAMAHRPKLLLLDEAASGLDPIVRTEFQDILYEYMQSDENSIFYSTHVISDISRLADEITFLKQGNIILRQERDALENNWRRLVTRPLGCTADELRPLCNDLKIEDGCFDMVTDKVDELKKAIHAKGDKIINEQLLSLDEISLAVLRGNHDR